MRKQAPDISRPRPVVLCILDGWGYREDTDGNAIALADTPNYDRMWASGPATTVDTAGRAVGLPDGQMGNSEVGHMNIGAGRIVPQALPRIDAALAVGELGAAGELAQNPAFQDMIAALKDSARTCHIMGLLSPGGVHSHQDHMAALGRAVSAHDIPVVFHAFLDGRDTPPKSALDYLSAFMADQPGGQIGTISGRYFAMDRDQRWNRTACAYGALTAGQGLHAETARGAIEEAYARGESDEFVTPTVVGKYGGMANGDAILMANFRADRARQILSALVDPEFSAFERSRSPAFIATVGMAQYSGALDNFMPALFPTTRVADGLGEIVAAAGLRQLRIAETEKYAHVTFFLNGGRETPFKGEDRILVPSPKVATYDLQPEMSAPEVTDKLVEAIGSGTYDLIVANYANPDMVGHTGDLEAAKRAVEVIDGCLGRLEAALGGAGGVMLVTADHGNIERMLDPETGQPHTAHTVGVVPVLLVGTDAPIEAGRLADIAPTILSIMGLAQPEAMTGHSLLQQDRDTDSEDDSENDHARQTA